MMHAYATMFSTSAVEASMRFEHLRF